MPEAIPTYCSHTATEIRGFFGPYRFLSNFHNEILALDGIVFQNGEAAFQAQKSLDREVKKRFSSLEAGPAKYLGRHITLRPDWEAVKTTEMERVVLAKFSQCPELTKALLETGNRLLVETNHWRDRCWGTDPNGNGENRLGKILTKTREILREKSQPKPATPEPDMENDL